MSETGSSLYQKYRPKAFTDVIGQDHIVKTLQGALKEEHTGHAYLFIGSRGTGKTSVARILARELGARERDTYEIDAASNTGVDNIRALREEAATMPFESPRKVYIVDEVHMLSKGAFNAFLKLLEEPPSHVVFILATTELEKVPETIISRCQTFTFKKPTQKVIAEMVSRVAKSEGFTLEPASAELISLLADGSFRDALSTLQKILASSSDKKVSVEEVVTVTGAPKIELVHRVIEGLAAGVSKGVLEAVGEAVSANADMGVFCMLLIQRVRILLMLRYAPEFGRELATDLTAEDQATLEKFSKEKESKINSETLRKLILASIETSRSPLPQLPLELAIMELVGTP
ncbi:DNA polymerase III, subunit gamma and tau [Candidatus Kaiserbacteria bacterium RIFCSPHIGHO2_01_FULL_48_10]|uniref:DNA polymerase III subunit gamma/tau n=1 Tax=Candidatus Kaiserbacteria bacterium RIFCSPHIGHO2_01_FULL_48_10 TaxID=1798476 RepID=A0A1F6C650_9BACT|nr:MAG: DNA polymerase III, subunit gamma and tau [Candidatus Kaiserbacteria bacterium RIFCSPHIGHO2_01_FULL_48_10]